MNKKLLMLLAVLFVLGATYHEYRQGEACRARGWDGYQYGRCYHTTV